MAKKGSTIYSYKRVLVARAIERDMMSEFGITTQKSKVKHIAQQRANDEGWHKTIRFSLDKLYPREEELFRKYNKMNTQQLEEHLGTRKTNKNMPYYGKRSKK